MLCLKVNLISCKRSLTRLLPAFTTRTELPKTVPDLRWLCTTDRPSFPVGGGLGCQKQGHMPLLEQMCTFKCYFNWIAAVYIFWFNFSYNFTDCFAFVSTFMLCSSMTCGLKHLKELLTWNKPLSITVMTSDTSSSDMFPLDIWRAEAGMWSLWLGKDSSAYKSRSILGQGSKSSVNIMFMYTKYGLTACDAFTHWREKVELPVRLLGVQVTISCSKHLLTHIYTCIQLQ